MLFQLPAKFRHRHKHHPKSNQMKYGYVGKSRRIPPCRGVRPSSHKTVMVQWKTNTGVTWHRSHNNLELKAKVQDRLLTSIPFPQLLPQLCSTSDIHSQFYRFSLNIQCDWQCVCAVSVFSRQQNTRLAVDEVRQYDHITNPIVAQATGAPPCSSKNRDE